MQEGQRESAGPFFMAVASIKLLTKKEPAITG